jgi:hypothetical protein
MAAAGAGDVPQEAREPHDYYGVPLWLMKEYLAQLGAAEGPDGRFEAPGWQALLEPAPWKTIGSLRVGGTRATFSGDAAVLAALFERLHWKTMRGGG